MEDNEKNLRKNHAIIKSEHPGAPDIYEKETNKHAPQITYMNQMSFGEIHKANQDI